MDTAVQQLNDALEQFFGQGVVGLISAVLILLVGWIVAAVVARVLRGVLGRAHLDERIAKATGTPDEQAMPVVGWIGSGVFWLLMLLFIMAALEAMHMTSVIEPIRALVDPLIAFLPALLAAAVLAVAAHIIGSIVRRLVTSVATSRGLDERLGAETGTDTSFASPLGDAAYYLVWLFFLPAILGALGLQSLLLPVQNMIDQFLAFVPFLVAAVVILVAGWFVARIVQRIVVGFLASAGLDGAAERVGLAKYMGDMTASRLIGTIVFVVVLIPVVTAALDALNLESLTQPLTDMLSQVLSALPGYLAAAALLVATYVIARWLIGIAVEIMTGVGVNTVPHALGLARFEKIGERTLAEWIGAVVLLIVMLLAVVQAAQIVGWTAVTVAVGNLGIQIVQVVLGVVIIAVGLYLANLVGTFIEGTTAPNKGMMALGARVAVLAFVGAMGLTYMGIAENIVALAFGLFFGAIAVAVALAFGLGGRDVAARKIGEWSETWSEGGPQDG